jgi:hypothetical protein
MRRCLLSSNARRFVTPKSKVRKTQIHCYLGLVDNVSQLKQVTEDQKKTIDQLETQKIEQKLDFDTQLNNQKRNFQQETVSHHSS